jgi:hypothetical protein
MTDFHPATTAIETIIGPHLTRDCARELARSIVENLLHSGWLQPADLTMPAIVAHPVGAHPVGASAPMWRGQSNG